MKAIEQLVQAGRDSVMNKIATIGQMVPSLPTTLQHTEPEPEMEPKPWVSLTDEEIHPGGFINIESGEAAIRFARHIEAKLKAKNAD
jgi:hypothetical protein